MIEIYDCWCGKRLPADSEQLYWHLKIHELTTPTPSPMSNEQRKEQE